MGKVVASASMSLDGYIAKDDNTIGHLFDWLDHGDIECRTISPDITFHLSQTSFDYWQGWVSSLGSLVCGRTLFDFTDGWGGRHTMDVPVVVVTHEAPADWITAHPDASLEFVTDGVEAAVARGAGDRRRPYRGCGSRHDGQAVPGAGSPRRGRSRPRARRPRRGPPVLR